MPKRSARLLILAAIFSGAFASDVIAQAPDALPGTLVIVGEAEQAGTPDIAVLTMGVTRENETASAALRAASQAMRDIISLVQKRGVRPRDIQTSNLSLQPRYGRPQRASPDDRVIVTGYIASNQLNLKVRNVEGLGELLDEVVSAGSNEIRGLSFDMDDRSKLLDEARVRAIQDAKRKATLFAEAADIRLGEIINLQDDLTGQQVRSSANRSYAESAGAPVPVEAGELSLRSRVRVTWRIAR
jgi:uncharacterized protein YggE